MNAKSLTFFQREGQALNILIDCHYQSSFLYRPYLTEDHADDRCPWWIHSWVYRPPHSGILFWWTRYFLTILWLPVTSLFGLVDWRLVSICKWYLTSMGWSKANVDYGMKESRKLLIFVLTPGTDDIIGKCIDLRDIFLRKFYYPLYLSTDNWHFKSDYILQ